MQKFKTFLSSIKRGARGGYVLAGPEALLRREAEEAIVRAVFGRDGPGGKGNMGAGFVPIDCMLEGGATVEPATVLDELRSMSLFSERKVVAARRADALVKNHLAAFLAYLDDPDPDAVLVLHFENWNKKSALAKKLDEFVVDCAAPYETQFGASVFSPESDLGKWIIERASRGYGLKPAPDAVTRLVELVGTSLAELDGALKGLATALGRGADVSAETVDDHVAPARSFDQFRIADLVARGRTREAFAAADACFARGMFGKKGKVQHAEGSIAAGIIWAIGREFGILHAARGFIDEGAGVRATVGRIGIVPWKADEVERRARAMPLETIQRAMELAYDAEFALKRGDADARFAVEKLLLDVGGLVAGASQRLA